MNTNKETETKPCTIQNVSGSIFIHKDISMPNRKKIKIKTDLKWFDCEYYTIKIFNDYILITKCVFEIPKNAKKLTKNKILSITRDIPLGEFDIDEESTEDELVVYYR